MREAPVGSGGEWGRRAIDLGRDVGSDGEKRAEGGLARGLGGPRHEWKPTCPGRRQVPLAWFLSDLQELFEGLPAAARFFRACKFELFLNSLRVCFGCLLSTLFFNLPFFCAENFESIKKVI